MSPFSPQQLIHELKRRKVFRVAAVYAVVAWGVIEIAETTAPLMALPVWVPGLVLFLSLLGFPIAVTLAWAFDVTPEGVQRSQAEPGAPGTTSAVSDRSHTATVFGAGVLVALVGFGAYAYVGASSDANEPFAGRPDHSLAVLPFDNLSAEEDNAFFAAGIHEEILTQLARLEDLKLISRTSVLPYDDTDKSVGVIGQELGVRTILAGSVYRHGNRIRVSAQLIDASTDEHLWADSYDRALDDVFAIQREIALAIADALEIRLTSDERARLTRRPTDDRRAHDLYLRGRHFWNQRTTVGLQKAIGHFQAALDRDPSYADAWAGLADAYVLLPYNGGVHPDAVIDPVRSAAERALELDPGLSAPHATLGLVHTDWEGDLEAGEAAYRQALELNPGDATAQHWLALNLWIQGRVDEALAAGERALELDPLSPVIRENFTYYLLASDRPEEALRVANEIRALWPSFAAAVDDNAALALFMLGDLDAAEARLRPVTEHSDGPLKLVILARLLAADGRQEEAAELLHRLEERAASEFVSLHALAEIAESAGKLESAAAYRSRARTELDPWRNFVIAISRLMDQVSQ